MGYNTYHDMLDQEQAEQEAITTTELGLPDKGVDLNRWIDEQVAANTFNHRTADRPDNWIRPAVVADIARGAVLHVIADRATLINNLANFIHRRNVKAGWWTDINTGEDLHGKRNIGELLALMHSEVSEALEATGDTRSLLSGIIKLCLQAIEHETLETLRRDQLLEIHASLSRALEAWRKNRMDDKLPHRPGFRVELVDCLMRILDTLGSEQNAPHEHPAGVIFEEKVHYNDIRKDHKIENRRKGDGKKI